MSINLGDNFKYLGKKFLDDRESFNSLSDMKKCNTVPDGFITYCKEDGKRYEYLNSNIDDPITGKWSEFKVGAEETKHDCSYVGDTPPEDDSVIWFDTGEGSSSEITYDNPIINELFACIRALQKQVQQLQADVDYIKEHGGGVRPPDEPDEPVVPDEPGEEIVDVVLALEDGGLFMLEDGGFMIHEEDIIIEKPDENEESSLALENGGLFMLENGGFIILEENISKVTESLMLLENGAQMLYENGASILLEKK